MRHSPEGKQLTDIIVTVFKLSGLLVLAGDKLTKDLGLSSARWKVLGALAASESPMTVPDIARDMGQTRQAVQRLVNEMFKDNLLDSLENPKHKRAKLLYLTAKGTEAFELMTQRQVPWVNNIASGMGAKDLEGAAAVLKKLTEKLGVS